MTIRAGVAGYPIVQSLSPHIHKQWIEAAGLDAEYEAYGPDTPDRFAELLDLGRSDGILRGLNVTAPYKEQAFAAADEVSETAALVGSANLLIFEDGRIRADSTDGVGLIRALAEQAPDLRLSGRVVTILGAGGAARAAAGALVGEGAEVRIVNRSRERAEAVAAALGKRVRTAHWSDAAADAALVVNALSIQPQVDLARLSDDAVVMDMTYHPLDTPLLRAARKRRLSTVDGLAMLIGQARPSFDALFGQPPPDVDVRALALSRLKAIGR